MKEAKFTPAPWKVWGDWAIKDCTKAENLIAQFEDGNFANAHLIAKSPNMYNKLWSVNKMIEEMLVEGVDERYTIELHEMHEEITSLLKSARGE